MLTITTVLRVVMACLYFAGLEQLKNAAVAISIMTISAIVISLLTNVWTTALIGVKTWQHWKLIRISTAGSSEKSSLPLKVMMLLFESGALYCVITTFYLISNSVWGGRQFTVNFYLVEIFGYIAGIYPTVITVLVGLQKTLRDKIFTDHVLQEGRTLDINFAHSQIRMDNTASKVDNIVIYVTYQQADSDTKSSSRL